MGFFRQHFWIVVLLALSPLSLFRVDLAGHLAAIEVPDAPPMPPEVAEFLKSDPELPRKARRLRLHTPEDVRAYFEAHRRRLMVLVEASEPRWDDLAHILEVPAPYRNKAYLREVVTEFMLQHDLAKMQPEVSKGLLLLFGENIRALPEGSPRRVAGEKFIQWFNRWDDAFGRAVFDGKGVHPSVAEFAKVLEKVVDIEDRVRSREAEIELGRPRSRASQSNAGFLDFLFKDFQKKEDLVEFFKQSTDELQEVYIERTRGLSYRAIRNQEAGLNIRHPVRRSSVKIGVPQDCHGRFFELLKQSIPH